MDDTGNAFRGLDLGADEHLVKPIVKQEFVAQVRSMVRRAKPPGEVPVEYRDSVVSLDLLTPDASFRGETVHVRPTEYRLLAYLALNHNRVLSHQELLDKVWGNDGGSLDSLKWRVSARREKLETDPKKPSNRYVSQGKLPPRPPLTHSPVHHCRSWLLAFRRICLTTCSSTTL